MWYLSSGRAYVQDERYAAGAGMRESGLFQFYTTSSEQTLCPPRGFAPHIPVLIREVPFILNITPSATCEIMGQWFLMDELP